MGGTHDVRPPAFRPQSRIDTKATKKGDQTMWKIFAGFIAFALLALFVIMKGGDKIDMQGESTGHSTSESASAPVASKPAAPPAAK
jgi:hypothetical protein